MYRESAATTHAAGWAGRKVAGSREAPVSTEILLTTPPGAGNRHGPMTETPAGLPSDLPDGVVLLVLSGDRDPDLLRIPNARLQMQDCNPCN